MGKRKDRDDDVQVGTPGKEKKSAKKHKKSSKRSKKEKKIKHEDTTTQDEILQSQETVQHSNKTTTPQPSAVDPVSGRVRSDSFTLEMHYEDLVPPSASKTATAHDAAAVADVTAIHESSHSSSNNYSSSTKKPTFFQKKVHLTVSLLPYSLKHCQSAIRASIRKQLLRNSDGWSGILLAFDNVQFLDKDNKYSNSKGKGWILNELPYIHYEVQCDVLVFEPSVGAKLQGNVSECFPSHISILVFGYINAMIPADTLHSNGYEFDNIMESWVNHQDGTSLAKKMKINFTVSKIHECEGTISLEGHSPARSLLVES